MPLNTAFRDASRKLFPSAKIVVPKNEIEAIANEALTGIIRHVTSDLHFEKSETLELIESACWPTKRLTKNRERKLRRLLEQSPKLKRSYEQKELLLQAYALSDRHEKSDRFFSWREGLSQAIKHKAATDPLFATDWQEAIIEGMSLSYADYFQRIQQLVEILRKLGRGYSIERTRGRLLYGEGLPAALRTRAREEVETQGTLFQDETFVEEQGSSIARLIVDLEDWLAHIPPENTEDINVKISR